MAAIKAVLFDLDGVLIDATEWHYDALNRALGLFGFSISRYEHLESYNGLPTRRKLEMLTVEKGLPTGLRDLVTKLKQVYTLEEIHTKCRPAFGKEYMLSRLAQEHFRVAVCSNAVRESVELMLRKAGLMQYFEFCLSNEDVKRAKPDPEIYSGAIQRLKCHPSEVLVVEDAAHGVEAARKAGAHVCRVSSFNDVDYFRVRKAIDRVAGDDE